jgi:hypothetical protein
MQVRLVVVGGKSKQPELLVTLPAVLGRGREATVRLTHALVSRKHCQLSESHGYVVAQDMGSLNGTFIDDQPITEAVLPPGGRLTLGGVTYRADYEPAAPAPAASPPAATPPAKFDDFEDLQLADLEEDDSGR